MLSVFDSYNRKTFFLILMLIANGRKTDQFLVQAWEIDKMEAWQIFLMPTAYSNSKNSGFPIWLVGLVLAEGLEADNCSQCMDGQCILCKYIVLLLYSQVYPQQ